MAIFFDIANLDIDFDALTTSEKYLTIGFIVLITLANVAMIWMTILRHHRRRRRQQNNVHTSQISLARYSIRLSLAIAGLLLAYFTHVIFGILLFKQRDHGLTCTTVTLARVFSNEFLPVVYGCGLVFMASDFISRCKMASISNNSNTARRHHQKQSGGIIPVLYAVFSWVIPLAIVCPLAFTDIDWSDNCKLEQSKLHMEARMVLCTLMPAGIALISGICALVCNTESSDHEPEDDAFEFPMYQGHTYSHGKMNQPPPVSNQYVIGYETNHTHRSTSGYETNHPYHSAYTKYTGRGSSEYHHYDQPSALPTSDYGNYTNTNEIRDVGSFLRTEKRILFASCVIFVLTVVPYNALCLYIVENYEYEEEAQALFLYEVETAVFITNDVFMWLLSVYPVLLPLLWLAV